MYICIAQLGSESMNDLLGSKFQTVGPSEIYLFILRSIY